MAADATITVWIESFYGPIRSIECDSLEDAHRLMTECLATNRDLMSVRVEIWRPQWTARAPVPVPAAGEFPPGFAEARAALLAA